MAGDLIPKDNPPDPKEPFFGPGLNGFIVMMIFATFWAAVKRWIIN